MLRRFLVSTFLAGAAAGPALAAVDVNSADEASLVGIKGIGPAKARAILDERAANGPFRDTVDLAERVKGLGRQTLDGLHAGGLALGPCAPAAAFGSAAPVARATPAGAQRAAPRAPKNGATMAIQP